MPFASSTRRPRPTRSCSTLHALEAACGPPGEPGPRRRSCRSPTTGTVRLVRCGGAGWPRTAASSAGSAALIVHAPAFVYVRAPRAPGAAAARHRLGAARDGSRVRRATRGRSFFGHHWSEAGAAFAAHVGARDDQRDVRAVLDLRTRALAGAGRPGGLAAAARGSAAAPDELVESFAAARDAMDDAPAPAGVEAGRRRSRRCGGSSRRRRRAAGRSA